MQLCRCPKGSHRRPAFFARLMKREHDDVDHDKPLDRRSGLSSPAWASLGISPHKIFTHAGYEVFACEPIESRRAVAIECGLKNVLPAVSGGTRPILRGTVGLVVDCSGHEQAVLDGCNIVRKKGEVVLIADAVAAVYGDVCAYHLARDFPQICGRPKRVGVGAAASTDGVSDQQHLRESQRRGEMVG